MRPAVRLAATVVGVGLVVVPAPERAVATSCEAPTLTVLGAELTEDGRPLVPLAGTVTVIGRGFRACKGPQYADATIGCAASEEVEPAAPWTDLELSVRQRARGWSLDTADASAVEGREGRVEWTFSLPPGTRPGPAVLMALEVYRLKVVVEEPSP